MAPRNKVQRKKTRLPPPPPKRKTNRSMILAIAIIAVIVIVFGVIVVTGQLNQPATTDPYLDATEVQLQTSMGNITVALRNDKPITTANFINLANEGVYDNTIFHRVIAGFMIQGGDPTGTGYGDSSIPNIRDEVNVGSDNHNYNGTIAMANTGAANSASSQFFINVANNTNRYAAFDTSYTVFGKVVSGMDVVMEISQVATNSDDKPLQDVTLISVTVLP